MPPPIATDGEKPPASAGVYTLLLAAIDSYEKLELTMVAAQRPTDRFEAGQLIEVTGVSAATLRDAMDELVAAEVMVPDRVDCWRLAELASLYV